MEGIGYWLVLYRPRNTVPFLHMGAIPTGERGLTGRDESIDVEEMPGWTMESLFCVCTRDNLETKGGVVVHSHIFIHFVTA